MPSKTEMKTNRAGLASRQELCALVQEVLAEAGRQGASAVEATIGMSQGLAVTVRLGEVETVEHTRDKSLGVTVYLGQRSGSASSSDLRPAALRDTVRAAVTIAKYIAADDCAGLADSERLAKTVPDLDLYHPWRLSLDDAIERALRCEQAARDVDSRIRNSEGASIASYEGLDAYANTNGFVGVTRATRHSLSCAVIGQDDSGMQRDYWYTVARHASELEAPEQVGRESAHRSLRRLGARKLATRRTPVLFEAPVAASILSHLAAAVRGSSLYRQASFLQDHKGRQVFAPHVRIHEQPHLPRGLGSAAFDNEGVATTPRDLVKDGILQGYVLDSYAARKLGLVTTGNAGGVHNLTIEPGRHDRAGLIKAMHTGLLVTELIGFGVNTVTGDYSRGAAGFWIENGEIQYPVEEITIAGNLKEIFLRLSEAGNDIDARGNIRSGSLLIEEMVLAGS